MGDPLHSDNTNSNASQKKKSDSRLASGQYSFPFSFPFPTSSSVNTNSISPFRPHTVGNTISNVAPPSPTKLQTPGHPHTQPRHSCASPLPPTFMEKDIDPNVAYHVSVRIVHGIFNVSSKIKTNITYFPATEPQPASRMRREAYEAAALVPCPMDDPEGWFALPTVTIYGVVETIDNLLHTKVDCTLYIAQPLSYTRGSSIPCFITIHSDSDEVEHLLSSTERPTVKLLRRVWHPIVELGDPTPDQTTSNINNSWAYVMKPTSDMNLVTHEVGHANWWTPPKNVVHGPNARHLEGEIHLSPDLQPSWIFSHSESSTLLSCSLSKLPLASLNLKHKHKKRTTSSPRIWLKSRLSIGRTNLFQLPIVNLRKHIRNIVCPQVRRYDFRSYL